MKRILTFIFAASIISTAAFTKNFFSQRYFEIKAGTEVGISNNVFSLNEIMKKDLVLDLKKIASAVSIPCIRKDFTVDEYMIYILVFLPVWNLTKVLSLVRTSLSSLEMEILSARQWTLLSRMTPMYLRFLLLKSASEWEDLRSM